MLSMGWGRHGGQLSWYLLFQLLENIKIAWEAETPPMLLGAKKGVAE